VRSWITKPTYFKNGKIIIIPFKNWKLIAKFGSREKTPQSNGIIIIFPFLKYVGFVIQDLTKKSSTPSKDRGGQFY
jgi:hypothetical protein